MVGTAAGRVNETAGDTRNEELVGDDEFDNRIELLFARFQHGVEFLSLRGRARKTVKYEAA